MPLPTIKPVWLIAVSNGPLSEGLYLLSRGGLDIKAYETKKQAQADLHEAKQHYSRAWVVRYVPVENS
jgi:hypothetical protein